MNNMHPTHEWHAPQNNKHANFPGFATSSEQKEFKTRFDFPKPCNKQQTSKNKMHHNFCCWLSVAAMWMQNPLNSCFLLRQFRFNEAFLGWNDLAFVFVKMSWRLCDLGNSCCWPPCAESLRFETWIILHLKRTKSMPSKCMNSFIDKETAGHLDTSTWNPIWQAVMHATLFILFRLRCQMQKCLGSALKQSTANLSPTLANDVWLGVAHGGFKVI